MIWSRAFSNFMQWHQMHFFLNRKILKVKRKFNEVTQLNLSLTFKRLRTPEVFFFSTETKE